MPTPTRSSSRTWPAAFGLAFHEGSGDPRAQVGAGRSLEDAARRLRYAFLTSVARAEGAQAIATGHTLDDQAETVLMRLLRGAGPWGLAGIPPVRTHAGLRLIRPLLEVPRDGGGGVAARREPVVARGRDESRSRDAAQSRARRPPSHPRRGIIRDVRRTLARLAEVMRDETLALDALAARRVNAVLSGRGATVRVALAAFARLSPALQRRALREAVRRSRGNIEGVGFVHLEGARRIALEGRSGAIAELPGGLRAVRVGRALEVRGGPRVPETTRGDAWTVKL